MVRSFRLRRMRAGTPALPERAWFNYSAHCYNVATYQLSAIGYRLLAISAFASASMAASADLPASSLMAVRPVAIR